MLLEKFGSSGGNLADMIMSQLHEKEKEMPQAEEDKAEDEVLEEKVLSVYAQIAEVLHKYTSGGVPKPFKVIPQCESWSKVSVIRGYRVAAATNQAGTVESAGHVPGGQNVHGQHESQDARELLPQCTLRLLICRPSFLPSAKTSRKTKSLITTTTCV